jgi:hypothetical protein
MAAPPAKLGPKFYGVGQRVMVRRAQDLMPHLGCTVLETRAADGTWLVEAAALGGKVRLPDAEIAPDVRRDEEVIYERRDGADVKVIVQVVDVSIWPPSYAIREKDAFSGETYDTNPGRLWPAKVRAVLKADAAMEELMAEEEAEAAKGKAGKKGAKKAAK